MILVLHTNHPKLIFLNNHIERYVRRMQLSLHLPGHAFGRKQKVRRQMVGWIPLATLLLKPKSNPRQGEGREPASLIPAAIRTRPWQDRGSLWEREKNRTRFLG